MFEKKIKANFVKMQEWLKQPLGEYLVKLETENVTRVSQRLYGQESLVIGNANFISCLPQDRIHNVTLLNNNPELNIKELQGTDSNTGTNTGSNIEKRPSTLELNISEVNTELNNQKLNITGSKIEANKQQPINVIYAKEYKIPITSESIDIVYLAHTLEVTSNPHEILREVYRVLRPEGYLIITCFNPFSTWGLAKIILYFTNKCPWSLKFTSKIKIIDWLKLLGFDIFQVENYLHNLPIDNEKYLDKFKNIDILFNKMKIPFSASFLILACKRMLTLTPIMPAWKTKKSILSNNSVVVPTPNVGSNNMKKDEA